MGEGGRPGRRGSRRQAAMRKKNNDDDDEEEEEEEEEEEGEEDLDDLDEEENVKKARKRGPGRRQGPNSGRVDKRRTATRRRTNFSTYCLPHREGAVGNVFFVV